VLPAAASLKKQGANNGATMAFLISTPESGVDSIALTYALLDPIMTVARPAAAFVAAAVAGLTENLFSFNDQKVSVIPDLTCPVDGCCDGVDCSPEEHRTHHSLFEKLVVGLRFAFGELWADIATWFFVGLLLAGIITAVVPESIMTRFLGGGINSMIVMLLVGIPLYICATASTPIAAALVLKGVSPGAALVFLLVGPATNITSLTVVLKVLGKRATIIYLFVLASCAVVFGLILDQAYLIFGLSPQAIVGQAAEFIPRWGQLVGAFGLLVISIWPCYRAFKSRLAKPQGSAHGSQCGCETDSSTHLVQISKTERGQKS